MEKTKKRKKRGIYKIWLLSLLLFLSLYVVFQLFSLFDIEAAFFNGQKEVQVASLDNGWNLILVNSEYSIPEDYEILELTELSNGEKVDTRIYPALQQMFDDARDAGLDLFVASGYRTDEKQKQLMDERIRTYQYQGYSKKKARQLALQWVAMPGTSEHQLGLAVDINANIAVSTSKEVYAWLEDNSYRYGFIKRYPSNKVHITGIAHEPWHYRYVGIEAAEEIYRTGVCLEEYIEE